MNRELIDLSHDAQHQQRFHSKKPSMTLIQMTYCINSYFITYFMQKNVTSANLSAPISSMRFLIIPAYILWILVVTTNPRQLCQSSLRSYILIIMNTVISSNITFNLTLLNINLCSHYTISNIC